MSSPIADVLADLARALEGVGEGWYLFGAQAALLRGSPRWTHDVDVTILSGPVSNARLVARLTAHGFSLRVEDVDAFVARTRVLPLVHDASRMPVDVVIGGPGLEELFLRAAEPMSIDGVEVLVPVAEHLVVMKLLAGRPTDLDDAAAMARANPIDRAAVRELVEAIADGLGEDDVRQALAELERRLGG